ncbi:MAG TPA: hypothetical protein V6C86_21045 [Oculatellaceae cyanobacterium]
MNRNNLSIIGLVCACVCLVAGFLSNPNIDWDFGCNVHRNEEKEERRLIKEAQREKQAAPDLHKSGPVQCAVTAESMKKLFKPHQDRVLGIWTK